MVTISTVCLSSNRLHNRTDSNKSNHNSKVTRELPFEILNLHLLDVHNIYSGMVGQYRGVIVRCMAINCLVNISKLIERGGYNMLSRN